MSDTLAKEITEYFRGERKPVPVYQLAKLYAAEAKFNLDWSSATSVEAIAAIRRAAEMGLVEIRDEIVYAVVKIETDDDGPKQMELF